MDGDDAAARRRPRHEAARDENYEESQPGHRRAAIGGFPSGVLVALAVRAAGATTAVRDVTANAAAVDTTTLATTFTCSIIYSWPSKCVCATYWLVDQTDTSRRS